MKFEEVLPLMREGKIAECGTWFYRLEGNVLQRRYLEEGKWVDCDCNIYGLLRDDWKIHEPPIQTFGPDRAMYWMKKGYRARKHDKWVDGEFIHKIGVNLVDERDKVYEMSAWFEDVWHLCDEKGIIFLNQRSNREKKENRQQMRLECGMPILRG
jgi:hypothetical protein